jgi:hypothetical protein
MPIRRYMEKGIVFTPEALSAMNKALTDTAEILGIRDDKTPSRREVHYPGGQSRPQPRCQDPE